MNCILNNLSVKFMNIKISFYYKFNKPTKSLFLDSFEGIDRLYTFNNYESSYSDLNFTFLGNIH